MLIEMEKKLMKLEPKLDQDRGVKELDPNFFTKNDIDEIPSKPKE